MHARSLFKGLAQSKLHVDEEDPSLNDTFLHGNLELNSVRSWGIEFPIFLLGLGYSIIEIRMPRGIMHRYISRH